MSYTRTQAQQMLSFYIEAEQAALAGQSISKDGRTWTRADLSEIRKGRAEWERIVRSLNPSRPRGPALAEFS